MDREKKKISTAHLDNIKKTWSLVIPVIIAIIGAAVFTSMWLMAQSRLNASVEKIQSQMTSADKRLLTEIRRNSRHTYLQLLQSQINPESDPDKVTQLGKELDKLQLQEREIIYQYDPSYVSVQPSVMEAIFETLALMPNPVMYTLSLGVGILLFAIARHTALFVISKRYLPSDYVREV